MTDRIVKSLAALSEVLEKARYHITGGVGVSSKQRRNIALKRGYQRNEREGYSRTRGPYLGSKHQLSPGASFLRTKPSVGYSYATALREAKRSGDKKWIESARQSGRAAINRGRRSRGLAVAFKPSMFGGLKPIKKAKAKTLYVYRPVENADEIIAWAKGQGFKTTLKPEDLHVTIAYSKTPLNWAKLYDDYRVDSYDSGGAVSGCLSCSDGGGQKTRKISGGVRLVQALGDQGAIVLAFQSTTLTQRWADFQGVGASWDYAGYTPHITITYDGAGVDLAKVSPYSGDIVLGEECWEEIDPNAQANIEEASTMKKALASFEQRLGAIEKAAATKETA